MFRFNSFFAFGIFFPITFIHAQDPSLKSVYDSMSIDMDPSDYTIHDPSRIITIGNKDLIAVTGKAQEDGYDCGIETWWRKTGTKKWNPGQCLFQTKPSWVAEESPENDGAYWAPELDLKDGVLTLLYSVSEWASDTPNTCVGVAKAIGNAAAFPDGLTWVDQGQPLTCIVGADYDVERSAIDPSVFWGFGADEGKLFLVTGGGYIIGTELDPNTYDQISGEWFDEDGNDWSELARGPKEQGTFDWVEAAYIHPNPRTGYYYLFVNWGACCSGTDSTYEIRVGRSRNPMGPYKDKNGVDLMQGGGTLVAKSGKGKDHYVIGPGHTGVWTDKKGRSFISFHYYDGRRDGNSWIAEKNLRFNKQGWPVVAGKAKRTFPMKKKKSN